MSVAGGACMRKVSDELMMADQCEPSSPQPEADESRPEVQNAKNANALVRRPSWANKWATRFVFPLVCELTTDDCKQYSACFEAVHRPEIEKLLKEIQPGCKLERTPASLKGAQKTRRFGKLTPGSLPEWHKQATHLPPLTSSAKWVCLHNCTHHRNREPLTNRRTHILRDRDCPFSVTISSFSVGSKDYILVTVDANSHSHACPTSGAPLPDLLCDKASDSLISALDELTGNLAELRQSIQATPYGCLEFKTTLNSLLTKLIAATRSYLDSDMATIDVQELRAVACPKQANDWSESFKALLAPSAASSASSTIPHAVLEASTEELSKEKRSKKKQKTEEEEG